MKKNCFSYCWKKKEASSGNGIHSLPSVVVLSGTKVLTGTGKMIITAVGKNSAIGQIEEHLKGGDELTPLQMKLEKIARDIGIFGLVAAVMIFLVLTIRLIIEESDEGWDEKFMDYLQKFLEYFLLAVAILVVAIPEGLPLAVTLSLAFSVNKMAEDQNLVRKM
jgi:magnesium-transporting ATPase (P-type)